MPDEPTLLRVLITGRHWQKFETFEAQFKKAAAELAGRNGEPRLRTVTVSRRQFERWYAGKFAEWSWTLAALEADVMAGFIALKDHHIDQLYVDPSQQRTGIGSALLGKALNAVSGRIALDVFEENLGARAFYEKHGFSARDRWMNTEEDAIDLLYVRG